MLFSRPYFPPPKEKVTDAQALELIVSLPAYTAYLNSQSKLDELSKAIGWNENLICKYQKARQKFDSDADFATSGNMADHKILLALLKPLERACFERNQLITLIWGALYECYDLLESDISRILYGYNGGSDSATVFIFWLKTGYNSNYWFDLTDYGFALHAADFINLCARNKSIQSEWTR